MSNSAMVASPGGVVITMLADDASLEAVVMGVDTIAHRLAPGGIHISMSTVAPATARKLAQYHAENGSVYIAAPVFGRPEAAAAKRLWICTAGPQQAKHKIAPILDAMGQKTFDFGEDPGAANALKLSGNFLIAAAMESMAEALAMLEKSGVDRVAAIEMLSSTIFGCPVYQGYGNAIAHMRHTPVGFRLQLGLKDVDLVLKTGAEARAPMPVASILRDRLLCEYRQRTRGNGLVSTCTRCARRRGFTRAQVDTFIDDFRYSQIRGRAGRARDRDNDRRGIRHRFL